MSNYLMTIIIYKMYQRIYLSCLLLSFFAVQAQITPDFNVITPCIGIDTRLVSSSTSIDNIVTQLGSRQ